MTKQLAQLQLNSLQTLSAQPSKRLNALSVNQKSDGEAFHRIFPSEREVAKGIDIRTSPIVKYFKLPEKELQFIKSGEPL